MKGRLVKFLICITLCLVLVFSGTACKSKLEPKPTGIDCTITFDVNGGVGSYLPINMKSGEKISLPSNPVRDGYKFMGWYLNDKKIEKNAVWQDVPEATLQAKWQMLFEVKNGEIDRATAYFKANETELLIPEMVDGEEIVGISEQAFQNITGLKTIRFAENSNIEFIDSYAFRGCTGLKEIVLPETLGWLGEGAFAGCTSLEQVVVSEGAYLEKILDKAFKGCSALKNFIFPESLTLIGEEAFQDCAKLSSLDFSLLYEDLSIEDNAFANCTKLNYVYLPSTIVDMGKNVFDGCNNLCVLVETETKPSSWDNSWFGTATVLYNCAVDDDKTLSTPIIFAKNRSDSISLQLSDLDFESGVVKKVFQNDVSIPFSFSNDTLTIAEEKLYSGKNDFKLVVEDASGNKVFNLNGIEIWDYLIGDKNEFMSFMTAVEETYKAEKAFYAKLDNNIDCEMSDVDTRKGTSTDHGYFAGVLDGDGYTVSNVIINNGIFWGLKNAVVKNIAFINVNDSDGECDKGLLAWQNSGINQVDNFYIQGYISHPDIDKDQFDSCALGHNINSLTMRNVIVNIEFGGEPGYRAVGDDGEFHGRNVYAISNTATKFCGTADSGSDYGLYKTVQDLKNNILPQSLNGFDQTYWDITSGLPVWKTLPKS